ncbi:hypothetical protein RB195_010962 [Necator americanus]|uniref:Uncharacterized protein n=1 Tax=Necator americanus TaxID=51031 RepID=A0ABR1D086_NECAM
MRPQVADSEVLADQKRPCACPETQVDSEDGLPLSAVPGMTHKIFETRTSIRPKACIQVTGRCKSVGLESSLTNKLHLPTPEGRSVLPEAHGNRGSQPAYGF